MTEAEELTRECAWCFRPLEQRADEDDKHFNRRISCNKVCAGKINPRRNVGKSINFRGSEVK